MKSVPIPPQALAEFRGILNSEAGAISSKYILRCIENSSEASELKAWIAPKPVRTQRRLMSLLLLQEGYAPRNPLNPWVFNKDAV